MKHDLGGVMITGVDSMTPERQIRGRSLSTCARDATPAADQSLEFGPRPPRAVGYAQAMSENPRVERGWIFVNGTRLDDGTIELGTGAEMRFSPFEAMSQRQDAQISWGHIITASVQRLAFWRR
jgi:hypothetical protein